jgi:hypothetical protein
MKQKSVSSKRTKKALIFFVGLVNLVIVVSCIESYFINVEVGFESALVVDALISDEKEEQRIIISESTSLIDYSLHAVHNCQVVVSDKDGNEFTFTENADEAYYFGIIPFEFLVPGNAFKICIKTANGKLYESEFETMTACPEVDSVYYEFMLDGKARNSSKKSVGLQFYVDVKAQEGDSQYYRWKLEETYEYHATWPIELYWEGKLVYVPGKDYSLFTCYKTEEIKELFAATTKNVANGALKYPLMFVDNSTQKLYWRYSLLLKQYSLTKEAYDYWRLLMINSQESGGLNDKQPATVVGNIKCVSNPSEYVLGYFNVSSVTSKRIFTNDEMRLYHSDDAFCSYYSVFKPRVRLAGMDQNSWPFYILGDIERTGINEIYFPEHQGCIDCRKSGGSLEVPEFWKE